jgi:hypothetical protein
MPFLDARALETDPDGLGFLSTVLRPDPDRRGLQWRLFDTGTAEPAMNTTLEILAEAATEQIIWAGARA